MMLLRGLKMININTLSLGGGLIKPEMRQNINFCYLEPDKELTAKLVMVFGLMRAGQYTETPRSLRFASVAEIDKFILGVIHARNYYLRQHKALTAFNYDYHYTKLMKAIKPLFLMKQ